MTKIISQLNLASSEFKVNQTAMQTLVNQLTETVTKIAAGGDEKARARHRQHGKLLPRERLQQLLDPGSPFLELSQLAAYEVYKMDDPYPDYGRRTRAYKDSHDAWMKKRNTGLGETDGE